MPTIEPFKIENQPEADAYLKDLLRRPEFRSTAELEARAAKLIGNEALKAYFLNKGKRMLESDTHGRRLR